MVLLDPSNLPVPAPTSSRAPSETDFTFLFVFRIPGLLAFLAPAAAWACPGCKEGVSVSADAGQSITVLAGFSLSVLLLLAAVAGAVFVLWRTVLKAVRESDAGWKQS